MAVGFSSCNKDKKVDIAYNVNVEVDPYNVIGGFKEFYDGDFNLESYEVLRIKLFVYDENGNLVSKNEELVSDYDEVANFKMDLAEGTYTFVAMSDVYMPKQNDKELWATSFESKLESLQVNYVYKYNCRVNGLLGLKMQKESITGKKDVTINIESASALVLYHMYNIHFYDNIISEYAFLYTGKPDKVNTTEFGFDFSCSEIGSLYYMHYFYPTDHMGYTGVYGFRAILPISESEFYATFTYENEEESEIFAYGTISLDGGKQYLLECDCETFDVFFGEMDGSRCVERSVTTRENSSRVCDIIKSNPKLVNECSLK